MNGVGRRTPSWNSISPCIMIVRGDSVLTAALSDSFTLEGYVVKSVDRGDEAVKSFPPMHPPDLVIFSIWCCPAFLVPEICSQLRAIEATRTLPIIMLSSRGDEALRLRCFAAGADDFVNKPFSTRELIARVRALLRRRWFAVANHLLFRGDLQLDHENPQWVRRGLRDVRVSRTEFRLLDCLLERPGGVFSRKHLMERVWGPSVDITDRAIHVHIARLRKSLSRGREPDPILTVPGAGYSFDESFGKSPSPAGSRSPRSIRHIDRELDTIRRQRE